MMMRACRGRQGRLAREAGRGAACRRCVAAAVRRVRAHLQLCLVDSLLQPGHEVVHDGCVHLQRHAVRVLLALVQPLDHLGAAPVERLEHLASSRQRLGHGQVGSVRPAGRSGAHSRLLACRSHLAQVPADVEAC